MFQLKLSGEKRNVLVKKIAQFYLGYGSREKTIDCVHKLLKFRKHIEEHKVNIGEYYYLLARVYAHKKDKNSAMICLKMVRNQPVRCEKVTTLKYLHTNTY